MVLKIKLIVSFLLYFPLFYIYKGSVRRDQIDKDIIRWCKEKNITAGSLHYKLIYLLRFHSEFRNLFYFRLQLRSSVLKRICTPVPFLSIADDCEKIHGGAIYFEHAWNTIIEANEIGYGCRFRNGTTIGVKSKDRHQERPWIGKNVDFGVNVTCIGNIRIGNNAIIGAGSVLVKDVPDNAIVAGNPAKIIKFRSDDTIN